MLKQEAYDHLIEMGLSEEALAGKQKGELLYMLSQLATEKPAPVPVTVNTKDLAITSKRSDRYWLEDGSHIMFKDIPEYIMTSQLTPYPKAKDIVTLVNGKLSSILCK